jgi:glucan biosynthesis protein C
MEKMDQDVASTLVFGIYQSFAQAFLMGLMFFLAGTLVPTGYDRKGFLRFVADRAVRLGVPSLAFMLVLNPLIGLIRRAGAGEGVDWAVFFAGYRDFVLSGRFREASGPLWFAVALLVFSILYAAERLAADVVQPLGTSVMSMQLGYFSSYVVLFVAGLWAGRNGLLAAIPAKLGRTWLWVSIAVGLNWQAAAIAAWEAFFCVGFSLGLLTLYRERGKCAPRRAGLNVGYRLMGLLKSTCFGVYTFHAPILVGISILLLPLAIHPLAKALLAAGLACVASTAFAWVVRRVSGVGRMFA